MPDIRGVFRSHPITAEDGLWITRGDGVVVGLTVAELLLGRVTRRTTLLGRLGARLDVSFDGAGIIQPDDCLIGEGTCRSFSYYR